MGLNPSTNGQVERFVQTLKQALRRMKCDAANVDLALSKLLQYRIMPHTTINKLPAEMFLNRKLYTRLDLIIPTKENKIEAIDTSRITKFFSYRERVACRNYFGREKWKFGKISARVGKLHYVICLDEGSSWTRHVNQMRSIGESIPTLDNNNNNNAYWEFETIPDPVPNAIPQETHIEQQQEETQSITDTPPEIIVKLKQPRDVQRE